MRGKELLNCKRLSQIGITPAYAGKSSMSSTSDSESGDHPRVCGEKQILPPGQLAGAGSPPRMRGKAVKCSPGCMESRITPAYAGKRDAGAGREILGLDHPRVCGEKQPRIVFPHFQPGSPPRMRGKVRQAGIFAQEFKDHPRVCGEKSCCGYSGFRAWGSPPRMRGKGDCPSNRRFALRITPAYAGKSLTREILLKVSRDHPRVCGEKSGGLYAL